MRKRSQAQIPGSRLLPYPSGDNPKPQPAPELTSPEREELTRHETIIERGLHTFLEVGQALQQIKQKRLYRETYATFEDYCREKLEISRIHAHRLVTAAEVCALLPIGNTPRPNRESQVRPLTLIPREKVPIVWSSAVQKAGNKPVTAQIVLKAVTDYRRTAPEADPTHDRSENQHWQDLCLKRLRKIKSHVEANAPEQILHELEAIRLLVEEFGVTHGSIAPLDA